MKMILMFQQLQRYIEFPNRTIGSKDIIRLSFNGLHAFVWVNPITCN